MAHAVTLLLIVLFAAPLTRHIPLAMLAGILLIVSDDMGEWREIPEVLKLGPAETAVWGIRSCSQDLADLTVAPDDVAIYRIHGPFLFGSSDKLLDLEQDIDHFPKVVILRLRNMTAIDATGLQAIERLSDTLRRSGRSLLLCGMRDQPARMMERAEVHDRIGSENLLPSVDAALARARLLTEAAQRTIDVPVAS